MMAAEPSRYVGSLSIMTQSLPAAAVDTVLYSKMNFLSVLLRACWSPQTDLGLHTDFGLAMQNQSQYVVVFSPSNAVEFQLGPSLEVQRAGYNLSWP